MRELLALGATLAVGFGIAWQLLAGTSLERPRRALWSVAWAAPTGFGLLSLAVFAARWAGLPRPTSTAFGAVGALALAISWDLARRHRAEAAVLSGHRPGLPRPIAWLAWAALALALLDGTRGVAALTRHEPAGSWDAVAVWNARARLLELGYDDFPALLAAVDRTSHPNYPPGLPGTVAGLAFASGVDSVRLGSLVAGTWAATAMLLLFLAVEALAAPSVAALTASWLVSTPLTVYWAAAQVGDVPIAVLLLGAITALASRLPRWPGPPLPAAFAGICLGLLPWFKNEGLLIAAIVAAAYVLTLWRVGGRRWHGATGVELLKIATAALPGATAAALFKLTWSPGSGLETYLQGAWLTRLFDPHRWSLPAAELGSRLLATSPGSWWYLVWPVPLAAITIGYGLGAGRRPYLAFAGISLAAIAGSWLPIYAASPYPLEWHVASSLDRLLLQVFPAVLLAGVAALAAARAGETPARGDGT